MISLLLVLNKVSSSMGQNDVADVAGNAKSGGIAY